MAVELMELEEKAGLTHTDAMESAVTALNEMFRGLKQEQEETIVALIQAEHRAQESESKVGQLTEENSQLRAQIEELKQTKSPTEQELFESTVNAKESAARVMETEKEKSELKQMLTAAEQLAGQLDLDRDLAQAALKDMQEQHCKELAAQRELFEDALSESEQVKGDLIKRLKQTQDRELALLKTLEDLRNNLQRQIFEQQLQLAGMEIPDQLLEMDEKKENLRETLWMQELQLAAIELPRHPNEPLVRFPERIFPQHEPASTLLLSPSKPSKMEPFVDVPDLTVSMNVSVNDSPVPKRRRTSTPRSPPKTVWPSPLDMDAIDSLTVIDESIAPATVKSKMCTYPGCTKSASYGYPKEKRRTRCKEHRLPNMENVKSRWCSSPECKTAPTYGFKGDPRSSRCKAHKLEGMVDIVNPRCNAEAGCSKQPSYGFPGDDRPTRCKNHKEEGMEDIKSRFCSTAGCKTRPLYGFIGDGRPTNCKNHKLEGMEDIMHPRCAALGCKVRPTFGNPNEKRPKMCEAHKTATMIDFRGALSRNNSNKSV